jgi:hypothetical protein
MPVTLQEAQVNVQDDVDFSVIDELRRLSWLLDQITFDDVVSPGTAGATLTYGYTRLVQAAGASFRAINSEYTPGKATRDRYTVDLKPLGGSFEVDRVLANLGPAATNEVTFQLSQLVTSVRTRFQDEMINGDVGSNALGFDGLDSSLAGTSTELVPGGSAGYVDWTGATIDNADKAHGALDLLDELVALVVGGAQAIAGNQKGIARVRSIGRRAGYYTRDEDSMGRMIERFGNAVLVDLGEKDNGSPIVPTESREVGSTPTEVTGLTDLYAIRFGMDAFHAAAVAGSPLVQTWLPDFTTSGAVKKGEAEMGPTAGVLKATKAAAVLRNVKVQ